MIPLTELPNLKLLSIAGGSLASAGIRQSNDLAPFAEQAAVNPPASPILVKRPASALRRLKIPARWLRLWRWPTNFADETRRWTDPAIAALDAAIIGCDPAGLIRLWTPSAATLLGYTASEAVGASAAVLALPDQAAALDGVLGDIRRGCASSRTELVLTRRDGARLSVIVTAAAVSDAKGRPIGASLMLRDVSEDRRRVAELAGATAQLAVLQARLAQLSRLSAMERVGLNLAHELNQPLAALNNYLHAAERLLAGPSERSRDGLGAALAAAKTQSMHLARIVKQLRQFVTRGETEKRVEPLAALVQEALSLAIPDAEETGVDVSLDLDPAAPLVLADRVQIVQVLVNLMRNAVEAMRACPRRLLSIASVVADDGVVVTVTDSGPGLPSGLGDRVFDPFVTTRPDGTGLGLAICRTIVEAHGGSLSCHSVPGQGCVFRFNLTSVADAET